MMITFGNENEKGGTHTIINCSVLTVHVNLKLDLLYYKTCWGQKVHVDLLIWLKELRFYLQ